MKRKTTFCVILQDFIRFFVAQMTLRSECYTNYTMTVQACNGPFLCSDYSDPISIRTLVGSKAELKDHRSLFFESLSF